MDEDLMMQRLAHELRQQCKKQYRHQKELAYHADINPSYLSEILNAKGKKQKITTLMRLCSALRIPPWLILQNAWRDIFDFENGKKLR